jgi:hypothetical protein
MPLPSPFEEMSINSKSKALSLRQSDRDDGWTFATVNAIAREVSNIQSRLRQVNGDDQDEVNFDHPLLTLLDGVNERMTRPELKYVITLSHLELVGNFYWLLDGVKNNRDKPRAIYPLNPGRVRMKPDKSRLAQPRKPIISNESYRSHVSIGQGLSEMRTQTI